MKNFPAVKKLWSVLSVNALAKLSKSASFDDIRKGNLHNENIIFVMKRASQICDQQFCYKELSNER
jgi:hypothetical protein